MGWWPAVAAPPPPSFSGQLRLAARTPPKGSPSAGFLFPSETLAALRGSLLQLLHSSSKTVEVIPIGVEQLSFTVTFPSGQSNIDLEPQAGDNKQVPTEAA